MMLVVILKPFRKLLQHVAGIVERMGIDIIPPERLDEGLGHPVRLGAVVRCHADHEPQGAGERDGIPGDIGRAVVAEPLDGLRQPVDVAEPGCHGLEHHGLLMLRGPAPTSLHAADDFDGHYGHPPELVWVQAP